MLITSLTLITFVLHTAERQFSETKTVSIKGVDAHLYAHYMELVKLGSVNSGTHFSHIMSHYMQFLKPGIPTSGFTRIREGRKVRFEAVENQDELIIASKDFGSRDLPIKYIFKRIDHLIFDESVTTDEFLHFVESIYDSTVEVRGRISKLVLASIDRSGMRKLRTSGEIKDITIRNVTISVYEEFGAMCHKEGITIGEGITKMLGEMIPRMEITDISKNRVADTESKLTVSMRNSFEVTTSDLEELKTSRVVFHRVNNLKFSPDITLELYSEKVLGIFNCDNVELPDSLPPLMKLSQNKSYP